ncbi:hypothetical protein E2C01_088310 [Portunus trituberculatus]|jgi:ATP-binding cassette subfamily B protein RaxB
MQRQ